MKNEQLLFTEKGTSIFDEYYHYIELKKLYSSFDNKLLLYLENSINLLERNLHDVNEKNARLIINKITIQYLHSWFPIFKELILQEVFVKSFSYNTVIFSNFVFNNEALSDLEIKQLLVFFIPYRGDIYNYELEVVKKQGNELKKVVSGYCHEERHQNSILETLRSLLLTKQTKIKTMIANMLNVLYTENTKAYTDIEEYCKKEGLDLKSYLDNESDYYPIYNRGSLMYHEYFPYEDEELESLKIIKANRIIDFYKHQIWTDIKLDNIIQKFDLELYRNNINKHKYNKNFQQLLSTKFSESSFWDIYVKVNNTTGSSFSYLLWTLTESFEKIDGISLEIIELGRGSLWAKIKTVFENEVSKEECKNILNKSKKALESKYLDKEILEVKKTEKEIEGMPDAKHLKENRRLELENRRLQNEKLNIENKLKKLEFIKGISELVKQGMLKVDSDFQIMINDLLYTGIENGKIIQGEDLDVIQTSEIYIEDDKKE
ncbi:hypothetical protein DMA11_06785 [Marinilabiliaceae bacterium JC017]|nr:hypothetical protein DMA11_06785 [Marinilabiliaceae bacterium JC017]